MMEERQQRVKSMVDSVYALVEFYHAKVQNEGMPEEDAKKYALKAVSELPYDANGYCWINDMKGIMVMHPTMPELSGTDVYDYKDANGKYIFHEFLDTVRNKGSGFVDYVWPKPNQPKDQHYPKLSYVTGYPPWNWLIGSGIYIDDVDTAFTNLVLVMGGLGVAFVLFVGALLLTLSESIRKR